MGFNGKQRGSRLHQKTGLKYNSQWAGGAPHTPSQCRSESWGLGADGRGQGNGWITAVTEVFNSLDRIRQSTEDSLCVAALRMVGNSASTPPGSSQAVLTAGFWKGGEIPSQKRQGGSVAEQCDKTQGAAPPHLILGCKCAVSTQDISMGGTAQPQDSSLNLM